MADFDIEADSSQNRLHMKLAGSLDESQASAAVDRVESEAAKLSPGFGVINDISEFKPLSQDVADTIADGKEILASEGAGALVRVTGDSALGDMQFDRVGGAEGYQVAKAETVSEAEQMLADLDD
ncbi:hypothetical protein [Halobacterium litoreum]|uniref:Uncharacterized protein n=1 Tax=Halobacterium litoreum TaxID=2039234 RepID=A0ABD5NDB1_9EURY|nr:hypothetical protein [Halobacterium litoreum]UHH13955.1 hypothetical protein LT972_02895 [Halobacterium litoreum]